MRPRTRLAVENLEDRRTPSFGTGGVVTADPTPGDDEVRALAVQADGKIVAAGGGAVARFNPDGTPDLTFNGTGARTLTGNARDVAIQPDGKIVVAGLGGPVGNYDFYLERLLPDGTPDPTFSGDGVVLTGFKKGGAATDRIYDIALQADGRIVAVGEINGDGQWGVARFTASGALDTSFSGDGWLTDPLDKRATNEWANAVAVQSDGRIVVAGGARRDATLRDWVVARYTLSGTLDSSFGTGGKAWVDFGPEAGLAWTPETSYLDMALAPDGRIVLTGESSGDRLGIARLTAAGALDPTFAGNGLLLTVPVGWTHVAPNEDHNVTVQADGRLVVSVNGAGTTAVGRLNADGSADASFDGDGWRTFDFGSPSGVAHAVLVQPDGKILVGGVVNNDGQSLFALARFNPDGTLDDQP